MASLAARFSRPARQGVMKGITQVSSRAPSSAAAAGGGHTGQLFAQTNGGPATFKSFVAARSFPLLSPMGRVASGARGMCMPAEEYMKRIQDVNDQFAEARLLIEVGGVLLVVVFSQVLLGRATQCCAHMQFANNKSPALFSPGLSLILHYICTQRHISDP